MVQLTEPVSRYGALGFDREAVAFRLAKPDQLAQRLQRRVAAGQARPPLLRAGIRARTPCKKALRDTVQAVIRQPRAPERT